MPPRFRFHDIVRERMVHVLMRLNPGIRSPHLYDHVARVEVIEGRGDRTTLGYVAMWGGRGPAALTWAWFPTLPVSGDQDTILETRDAAAFDMFNHTLVPRLMPGAGGPL